MNPPRTHNENYPNDDQPDDYRDSGRRLSNERVGEFRAKVESCEQQIIALRTKYEKAMEGPTGLVAEFEKMKEYVGSLKKVQWILVTALVGTIVTMILTYQWKIK